MVTDAHVPAGELVPLQDAITQLARGRDTVYRMIRREGVEIYYLPGDRRSYLRREDVELLKMGRPRR